MDRGQMSAPAKLWLANAAGNALLLAAVYGWLGIPERSTAQLALSAVLGAAILFAAAWLHTATFRTFSAGKAAGALRHVPAFLTCVLAGLLLWLALLWVESRFPAWSAWTASALTYRLRRPVRPEGVRRALDAVAWMLGWVAIPLLLLPRASAAAAQGFGGLVTRGAPRRFYLDYLIALAVGAWLPWRLVHWTPEFSSFFVQVASFVLRFGAAWILAVTAWLWIAWASAGRR